MAIEASLSKYKKGNLKIAMVVLLGLSLWFAYDGYYNKSFIEKHTNEASEADSTLKFNRQSPPYFFGGAIIVGAYYLVIRNKKVVAGDDGLVVNNKTIAYDSIEKIDKTHFDSKGHFVITYKNQSGQEASQKLSSRTYDNLSPVLEHLIAKIS